MKMFVYTDGGARNNPGPAGIGVLIAQKTATLPDCSISFGDAIGNKTNNEAEYQALIAALEYISLFCTKNLTTHDTIVCHLDSQLVVSQLNGLFKVKKAHLRDLLLSIRLLEQKIPAAIHYKYIPRSNNQDADGLVNLALDYSI